MPPIPEVINTFDKLKELHRKKNDDYAGDKGAFFNFDFCAYVSGLFKSASDKVFATFVSVKLARLAVLLSKNGDAVNESVEDSFDDLIAYAAIWKADYIRRKKSNKPVIYEEPDTY